MDSRLIEILLFVTLWQGSAAEVDRGPDWSEALWPAFLSLPGYTDAPVRRFARAEVRPRATSRARKTTRS